MSDTATVLLTLVGIGVIVVGVLLLVQLQQGAQSATRPAETVVVREVGPRWRHGFGPYYSHLPFRPVLY